MDCPVPSDDDRMEWASDIKTDEWFKSDKYDTFDDDED
jgi:hypothetical protein